MKIYSILTSALLFAVGASLGYLIKKNSTQSDGIASFNHQPIPQPPSLHITILDSDQQSLLLDILKGNSIDDFNDYILAMDSLQIQNFVKYLLNKAAPTENIINAVKLILNQHASRFPESHLQWAARLPKSIALDSMLKAANQLSTTAPESFLHLMSSTKGTWGYFEACRAYFISRSEDDPWTAFTDSKATEGYRGKIRFEIASTIMEREPTSVTLSRLHELCSPWEMKNIFIPLIGKVHEGQGSSVYEWILSGNLQPELQSALIQHVATKSILEGDFHLQDPKILQELATSGFPELLQANDILKMSKEDTLKSIQIADNLTSPKLRTNILEGIAKETVLKDPTNINLLNSMLDSLPLGSARLATAGFSASEFAKVDPASSLAWSLSLQDPALKNKALYGVVEVWVKSNPVEAVTGLVRVSDQINSDVINRAMYLLRTNPDLQPAMVAKNVYNELKFEPSSIIKMNQYFNKMSQ